MAEQSKGSVRFAALVIVVGLWAAVGLMALATEAIGSDVPATAAAGKDLPSPKPLPPAKEGCLANVAASCGELSAQVRGTCPSVPEGEPRLECEREADCWMNRRIAIDVIAIAEQEHGPSSVQASQANLRLQHHDERTQLCSRLQLQTVHVPSAREVTWKDVFIGDCHIVTATARFHENGRGAWEGVVRSSDSGDRLKAMLGWEDKDGVRLGNHRHLGEVLSRGERTRMTFEFNFNAVDFSRLARARLGGRCEG